MINACCPRGLRSNNESMAMPRKPMAQYLLEKGYVTQEQLDEGQKVLQQSKSSDLGRVLVELGYVGEREMLESKAQEEGLNFVDLDRYQIDSGAINLVPERIVKNHTVIPVRKEGNMLYLAMPNPNNIQAIDDVRMVSRLDVRPVRAVPEAIEEAIRKHYGSGNGTAAEGGLAQAASAAVPASSRGDISQAIAEAGAARGLEDEADAAAAAQVAEQAPIIRLANALIQQAIQDRASDIHVVQMVADRP
jgi:type IV pilus assembly protein PilB